MVLNIGGFNFSWKQLSEINIDTDFGISSVDRIQNHPALLSLKKESQTINLSGQTLPANGDKQTALKKLYELGSSRKSYPLVNGYGKYFGKFTISKISEKQTIFTNDGAFFVQNFSIELLRDYDQ